MSPKRVGVADGEAVAVFAKAPVPGGVKTRLAMDIGPAAATEVYRRIGRRVIAAAAAAGRATVVWYAPPGKRAAMRSWLDGVDGLTLRAQASGGLGRRLARAFALHFAEGARRVVITGTDCPGVTSAVLARAFRLLHSADVVLGPAHDGGYYLIGLRAPAPALFRGIPWSTGDVYQATVRRVAELGRTWRALPRLRDLDTLADARALGIARPRRNKARPGTPSARGASRSPRKRR